jgi:hypothetical protein
MSTYPNEKNNIVQSEKELCGWCTTLNCSKSFCHLDPFNHSPDLKNLFVNLRRNAG